MYVPALKSAYFTRKTLSLPQGTLIVSEKIIKDLYADILVGDIVSRTLRGKIRIIDYKTRRNLRVRAKISCPYRSVFNPAGVLSLETRTFSKTKYSTLFVFGEEDLVPLAYSLEQVYDGKTIAYGQPDIGIVLIRSNKIRALKVLKTFKPDMIVYNKV